MQVLGNRQSKPVIGETEFGGYGNSVLYLKFSYKSKIGLKF